MTERKTIPLVEPEYFDRIIRDLEGFDKEELRRKLASLQSRRTEPSGMLESGIRGEDISDSIVQGYIWYAKELGLVQSQDGRWRRTDLGNRLARTSDELCRKELWLQVVSQDRPFKTYFEKLRTPQPLRVIYHLPNRPSGKYLNRWAQWLGVQTYSPKDKTYVVILSDYRPGKEEFFEKLSEIYERLNESEFAGVPRYDVSIPELRYEICTKIELRPIVFDHLLEQLLSDPNFAHRVEVSGARYETFWKWKSEQPFRLDGIDYYYIRVYPPKEEAHEQV